MHKTINEKLQIIKDATTKKKIKMLSIKHGITIKTIRTWIKRLQDGKLDAGRVNGSKIQLKSFVTERPKPFASLVYKVFRVNVPAKKNGGVYIYRYLIKDTSYGFIFTGYSLRNKIQTVENVLETVVSNLKIAGFDVKEVITDKTVDINDPRPATNRRQIEHNICSYGEIKKYFSFSRKKNSYIKDREKYEVCSDFLFDSLSTAAKNNEEIFFKNPGFKKDILKVLKNTNIDLHNSSMCMCGNKFCDLSIGKILLRKFGKACAFQKAFDLENSVHIFDQLSFILRGSMTEIELYIKVILKTAEALGLKGKNYDSKKLITSGLNLITTSKVVRKNELRVLFYTLLADIYRYEMNKSRAFYYMKTAGEYAEKTKDHQAVALNHIYLGSSYLYFEMPDHALTQFNMAKKIAGEHDLKDVLKALEESEASMYKYTGRYSDATEYFKTKILDNSATSTPFVKALLRGKLAEVLHYNGDLIESLRIFDTSIDLMQKYPEIIFFSRILLLTTTNKALVLIKMNEYRKALNICMENLSMARKLGEKNILMTNLSYILIMHAASGNLNESEKYINDLSVLLKNDHKPEHEYKYFLGKAFLHRARHENHKAEECLLRAVSTAEKISSCRIEYFESSLSLADLHCEMHKQTEVHDRADEIISRAAMHNLDIYSFKAEILRKKADCLRAADHNSYLKYLHELKKSDLNDEKKYYIESQIARMQSLARRASDIYL